MVLTSKAVILVVNFETLCQLFHLFSITTHVTLFFFSDVQIMTVIAPRDMDQILAIRTDKLESEFVVIYLF